MHRGTERGGTPLVAALTAGQRHERTQAIPLLARTTERRWPQAVAGDEGYRGADLRTWLGHRAIAAVIPSREDELGPPDDDRDLYRDRPVIEQTINRRKRVRRIATRSDTLASSSLATVTLAMILEWL